MVGGNNEKAFLKVAREQSSRNKSKLFRGLLVTIEEIIIFIIIN